MRAHTMLRSRLRLGALALSALFAAALQAQQRDVAGVIVRVERESPYVVRSTSIATRTDTPIEQIPQSVVVIPRQVIDDQGATTLSDITRNVSSVQAFDQRDVSTVTSFKIRGFNAGVSVDGVATQGFFANFEPVWNIQQVDVVKGPTGSLFSGSQTTGSDAAGGAIAITSKAPERTAIRQVGARAGSYGDRALYFDFNQPLGEQFSIRVVGQNQEARSETDRLSTSQQFIAPSLAWQPSADSRLTLRLRHSESEFLDYTGLPNQNTPRNQILVAEGQPRSKLEIDTANLQWTQRLNEVWSWGVTLAQSRTRFDGRGIFFNEAARQNEDMRSGVISPYVSARFTTGDAKHTLLAGYESTRSQDNGYIAMDPASLFNCFFFLVCSYTQYSAPYAPWVDPAAPADPYNKVSSRTDAFYLQDQIDLARLHLQFGLRHAKIRVDDAYANDPNALIAPYDRHTTQSRTSPRVGAVFDLSRGLSVFAGYGESFRLPMYGAYVDPVKPETSKQTEVGLKLADLHGVTATLAWFDMTRKNVPADNGLGTVFQVGKQHSRGLDLDLNWQATRNLMLIAAFNRQRAITVENQFLLASEGKMLLGIPESSARLAARYEFRDGALSGLGVGFGLRHHSQLAGNSTNTFFTPAATVYDAQLGYRLNNVQFGLVASNLFDRKYFVPSTQSQVMPALRRTVMLNATLNF